MKQQTLQVQGAEIYYEVRGSSEALLLLIPGGPTDADIFAILASKLEDRFTVVTYDPRGNSRSTFDDELEEQSLDVHGNDAAVLISHFKIAPAFVFGNSSGAQIGLNLCSRYPQLVRRLVAHEPPCVALLDDSDQIMKQMNQVVETYHSAGVGPAMGLFLKAAGMSPPLRTDKSERAPSRDMKANVDYFLEHGVRPIALYRPNIDALRKSQVVVGVGAETEGQLAHRASIALARELGISPVVFPGDHSGWMKEPTEFAKTLVSQLA